MCFNGKNEFLASAKATASFAHAGKEGIFTVGEEAALYMNVSSIVCTLEIYTIPCIF